MTSPSSPAATPFTHGVASFDPTATSVLLWARAPGVVRLAWRVARRPGGDPVAAGEAAVPPGHDDCVTVDVDGLDPATSYVYWFEAGGTRSPVGRTRTLPAQGTDPLRLAVVSCGDFSRGHYAAYRAVAEADVDLVLHVGDYIYETRGKGTVRQALPDRDLVTADDYRVRYAQARADADLMALHLRHPVVAVWDDHDIADNAWRHGAKHHDPNVHGPWEDRLRAAATAHQEWLPARLRDPDDLLAVYRSFAFGDLAEVVVLDTRIDGRDQQADDEPSLPFDDPRRALLGAEQRRWAHDRVRDTTRPWCLLVSQVVVNRMVLPVPRGERLGDLAPSGYAVIGGEAMCTDEWDGYPAEREALTGALAARGSGAVIVSGDVHSAWAFEGPCPAGADDGADDGGGRPVAVELVAPCVTATPMGRQLPAGWRKLLGPVAEQLPEARWFELERHGFLVVEVDEQAVTAHWYAVDTEDPAPHPEHAASWRHRLDRPGRLDPVDPGDGSEPGTSRPFRPRERPRTGTIPRPEREGGAVTRGLPGLAPRAEAADRPHLDVPPRPAAVREGVELRRRRRRRLARLAVVTAGAAAASVLARRRRPDRHGHRRTGTTATRATHAAAAALRPARRLLTHRERRRTGTTATRATHAAAAALRPARRLVPSARTLATGLAVSAVRGRRPGPVTVAAAGGLARLRHAPR